MLNSRVAIFLLGDPASGKGSIATELCLRYGLVNFDMGKELQLRRERDQALSVNMTQTYDKGVLVDSEIVLKIHEEFFEKFGASSQGVLFNGGPKKIEELEVVLRKLEKIGFRVLKCVYLQIPQAESVRRALVRATYDSSRQDDNVQSVTNRFVYYRTEISKVVARLEEVCGVERISGDGSVDEIAKRVVQFLDNILEHEKSG